MKGYPCEATIVTEVYNIARHRVFALVLVCMSLKLKALSIMNEVGYNRFLSTYNWIPIIYHNLFSMSDTLQMCEETKIPYWTCFLMFYCMLNWMCVYLMGLWILDSKIQFHTNKPLQRYLTNLILEIDFN